MDQVHVSAPHQRGDQPYEHHRHVSDQRERPPSRAPPPAPVEEIIIKSEDGGDVEKYTSALSWDGSEAPPVPEKALDRGQPSRPPPIPEKVAGDERVNIVPAEPSQSPPLPPTSHTSMPPPPRTDSVSPHSITYKRVRADSLHPSHSQPDFNTARSVSTPLNSRPNSTVYQSELDDEMGKLQKNNRRKSSLMNIFGSPRTTEDSSHGSRPWIITGGVVTPYMGMDYLLNGEKIPELWDTSDLADLFVYLYPRESGRGPQIKCASLILQSSRILQELAQDGLKARARARSFDGRGRLSIEDATRNLAVRNPVSPPYTPRLSGQEPLSATESSNDSIRSFGSSLSGPRELHLYLPLGLMSEPSLPVGRMQDDSIDRAQREAREQAVVDARNLFAFLDGQAIVFTPRVPSPFRAFLAIASLLKLLGYNDERGNTFGQAVNAAFDFFLTNDFKFADVRESREKTLEGLILGEAMRSEELYSEAFAHAVGKYDALSSSQSLLWNEVSPKTKQWIERTHLQLKGYQSHVKEQLTDFEFPSIFAGVAASTSSEESKIFRFKTWKSNFLALRKAVLSYYKHLHGAWPPKASSKKNAFVEGGLNRLVLKGLYTDLCCLYDFLVDRNNVTTRATVAHENDTDTDDGSQYGQPTPVATLRKVLNEFDRSTTWTTPAMPLDAPLLPSLSTIEPHFYTLSAAEQHKLSCKRKLKDNEIQMVVGRTQNLEDDPSQYTSNFMNMFRLFEAKEARHKTLRELEEQRIGHWIFLYSVLQVLPLLISDAPRLNYTESVEYFLSATPPENMPWIENTRSQMDLYQTADGTFSRMPAHQVEFGINSIYSRSHCWQMAQKWTSHLRPENDPEPEPNYEELRQGQLSPLMPPPGFAGGELRPASRGREHQRASSAGGAPRPRSAYTTSSGDGHLAVREPRSRNGSRNRLSQRQSIALGLESLPRFGGFEESAPSLNTASGTSSPTVRTPPEEKKDVTFDNMFAQWGGNEGKEKKAKKKSLW